MALAACTDQAEGGDPATALDASYLPVQPSGAGMDGSFVYQPGAPDAGPIALDGGGPLTIPPALDAAAAAAGGAGWCGVQPVFATYCTSCHDGQGTAGTPMGLKSYQDLSADSAQYPGVKVYTRVGVRMHAAQNRMPPQAVVTPAEQKLVDDWIAAGAPPGASTSCAAATPGPDAGTGTEPWPADCEEPHKFTANTNGQPFSVGAGKEFYQDFVFDAPWSDGEVQAVGFRSIIDNTKVLHHWILYQGESSFLVGWSPGKNEKVLPPDVGVYMPGKGNKLKLTVHYYNARPGATAQTDGSGVEICVTKKPRPKTAFTMPFAAFPSVDANSTATNSATCTVSAASPVHLITSSPHMHKLGVHAKFEVLRTDGSIDVVTDVPFSFEEQLTHPIDVVLNNGDQVRTSCTYMNNTSQPVSFGTSTDAEMCFNFALYYPMCGMTCTGDIGADLLSATQGGGCPTSGGGAGGGALGGGIFGF